MVVIGGKRTSKERTYGKATIDTLEALWDECSMGLMMTSLLSLFSSQKVLRGMLVNFSSPNFSAAPGNIPIRRSENTRRRLFLFLRVYLRFGNVSLCHPLCSSSWTTGPSFQRHPIRPQKSLNAERRLPSRISQCRFVPRNSIMNHETVRPQPSTGG